MKSIIRTIVSCLGFLALAAVSQTASAYTATMQGTGTTQSTNITGSVVTGVNQFFFNNGSDPVLRKANGTVVNGATNGPATFLENLSFTTDPNCTDVATCPIGVSVEPDVIGGMSVVGSTAWFAGNIKCYSGSTLADCVIQADPRITDAENVGGILAIVDQSSFGGPPARSVRFGRIHDSGGSTPDVRSLFFGSFNSLSALEDVSLTPISDPGDSNTWSLGSSGNPNLLGKKPSQIADMGDAALSISADYIVGCKAGRVCKQPSHGFTCTNAATTNSVGTGAATIRTCHFNGYAGAAVFIAEAQLYAANTQIFWLDPDDSFVVAGPVANTAANLTKLPQASVYSLSGITRTFSSGNMIITRTP